MLSHVYWKKCGSKRSYIKSKPICISIYEYVIKAMSLNLSSNNAEQRLPGLQIQLHSCTIKTGVHGEAKTHNLTLRARKPLCKQIGNKP